MDSPRQKPHNVSSFLMGILSPESNGQHMDNRLLYSLLTQQLKELKLSIAESLNEELALFKFSMSEMISKEILSLSSSIQCNTKSIEEQIVGFESNVLASLRSDADFKVEERVPSELKSTDVLHGRSKSKETAASDLNDYQLENRMQSSRAVDVASSTSKTSQLPNPAPGKQAVSTQLSHQESSLPPFDPQLSSDSLPPSPAAIEPDHGPSAGEDARDSGFAWAAVLPATEKVLEQQEEATAIYRKRDLTSKVAPARHARRRRRECAARGSRAHSAPAQPDCRRRGEAEPSGSRTRATHTHVRARTHTHTSAHARGRCHAWAGRAGRGCAGCRRAWGGGCGPGSSHCAASPTPTSGSPARPIISII